jgi:histidinol-phosphate phosphatase family protein|tara:strand:- start:3986 stop:4546 length:561 start_codon:yes stop_codon:yes gene_type:complete
MSEHKPFLSENLADFTIFLDRDGVINLPIVDDYAKQPNDFILGDGVLVALEKLQQMVKRLVMVTNQQGVHRKVMNEKDLENVHLKLYNSLKNKGLSYFDASFYAPYLKEESHEWRKPKNGMLLKAKSYFPDIDWSKAIMVGDSPGDMQLADTLGITKVKIANPQFSFDNQDYTYADLGAFVAAMSK